MEGNVAMEWKDPNPGHSSGDVEAGFETHGLSAALSPSREQEGRSLPLPLPLPLTPQFGQKTPVSSLAERMQARAGFKVPKLMVPFSTATGADTPVSGAPSPYLTIPPGLSPASLLESPVFVSNAMGQPSPTTGKLFMSGGTNDNDPIRFGGPPVEDGPDAFSFKPLDLKSSHYTAVVLKEQNIQASVRTEAKTQPAQEANLLGQLNQLNHNVQTNMNSGGPHDSKLNHLASGTCASNEHVSPPDYYQTPEHGDAREDYPAMAATGTAEDGYSWRKYGQKQVKHSEYPRSYFKCTQPNCQMKKKVERSHEGHITEIIYKGSHNHPKPAPPSRPRQAGVQQPMPPHPFGDAAGAHQADADLVSSQQANAAAETIHQTPRRTGVLQDGMDATSPPSVPGELCDSAASMQVECTPRGFGSPEGADVTSAPCDEVDRADRVTLGSMSHGRADADGDELESKRRKLEAYATSFLRAPMRAGYWPRVYWCCGTALKKDHAAPKQHIDNILTSSRHLFSISQH